jgi:hypothetical protein
LWPLIGDRQGLFLYFIRVLALMGVIHEIRGLGVVALNNRGRDLGGILCAFKSRDLEGGIARCSRA